MYTEQETEKMKAMQQAEMNAKCAQSNIGLGQYQTGEPCRLSVRERLTSQLHRASSEARKVDRLSELTYLLDKNPEVARILDLMDEIHG